MNNGPGGRFILVLGRECKLIGDNRTCGKPFLLLAFIILAAFFLTPFLWMFFTSLKANHELFNTASGIGGFLPEKPLWSNYQKIFSEIPYLRYLLNSLAVALGSAAIETCLAATAAFGLAILRWKHQSAAYWLLSLTWLVPFSVVLIPRFLIFAWLPDLLGPGDFWSAWRVLNIGGTDIFLGRLLGLDSFAALILPGSLSITATFILIAAMKRIPPQLLEVAYLDGSSGFGVFRNVVLPLGEALPGNRGFFSPFCHPGKASPGPWCSPPPWRCRPRRWGSGPSRACTPPNGRC